MCLRSSESTIVEKVKVTSAEIIVRTIRGEPYYTIRYRKVGSSEFDEGYGSSDLSNVQKWLYQCFDVENDLDNI